MPALLAGSIAADVEILLDAHHLKVRDVDTWVVHAGGPRILDGVREALDLDEGDLQVSREVLAAVGNLSSASVLHVLAGTSALPGGIGVLMAFGPGVGAEYVLLRWPEET